jgi:hypothetical protein
MMFNRFFNKNCTTRRHTCQTCHNKQHIKRRSSCKMNRLVQWTAYNDSSKSITMATAIKGEIQDAWVSRKRCMYSSHQLQIGCPQR